MSAETSIGLENEVKERLSKTRDGLGFKSHNETIIWLLEEVGWWNNYPNEDELRLFANHASSDLERAYAMAQLIQRQGRVDELIELLE